MRAGKLDARVVLQRKTLSRSPRGEPVETWSTLATRWASVGPLPSVEVGSTESVVARERVEFRIRWENMLSDLSPIDRIIYPADDVGESPIPVRSIYDINAVGQIGRREVLQIQCFRRSDVLT